MLGTKYFSVSATFLVLVLAFEIPWSVSAVEGQSIGSVYQCAHDFRGEVFVKNDREIIIKGLNYDGKGPAAWFHGQLKGSKGIYTSDPEKYMTLPYPNAVCDRLKVGKSYKDEEVSLILPVSIKEFETIGVLCYQYCHNFGHIVIPENLNVTAAPEDLLKTEACPKPKYDECSLTGTRRHTVHSEIRPTDCVNVGSDDDSDEMVETDDMSMSLSPCRNGGIKPDCKAGAGQLLPSVLGVIVGGILAISLVTMSRS